MSEVCKALQKIQACLLALPHWEMALPIRAASQQDEAKRQAPDLTEAFSPDLEGFI